MLWLRDTTSYTSFQALFTEIRIIRTLFLLIPTLKNVLGWHLIVFFSEFWLYVFVFFYFFLFSILIFSEKENWQFSIKIPLKCWNNAFWLTKVLGKICKKASPQPITVEHNTNLLLLPTSETLGRMGKRFGEQGYLGSFGWTSLNYDWSMVFRATKQTKTFIHTD